MNEDNENEMKIDRNKCKEILALRNANKNITIHYFLYDIKI